MHSRFKPPPLPARLPRVNGCDSSSGMSNAFTNTKPVSSHRAWYTDNLNVCSPLIIPFTTSLYWIIHLHTSDWDQQQRGLVCGCASFSLGWGLITSVSWVGTTQELEAEWGLFSSWRCIKEKRRFVGIEECGWTDTVHYTGCCTINLIHYFTFSTLTLTLYLNEAYTELYITFEHLCILTSYQMGEKNVLLLYFQQKNS